MKNKTKNKLEKIGSDYIESEISGIPCLIQVETFHVQAPFQGSPHLCDSDMDYYGYTEIEFSVFDRKGYAANWLEKKLTDDDNHRIEVEILESAREAAEY